MLAAVGKSGGRLWATPNAEGVCPICGSELIPKCGEIKTWHWAHKSLRDCDTWSEPESDWHCGWKKLAGLENTEIVIKKDNQVHRADIRTPGGLVIELQHSPLPVAEIRDREKFYKNMIWVLDGDEICPDMEFNQFVSRDGNLYFKHGRIKKAWVKEIRKPLYIHFSHRYYDTYYYWNEYTMWGGTLQKHLRKSNVKGAPNELKDFLLRIDVKYCEVITSRAIFLKQFGLLKSNKTKSAFDFEVRI